MYFRCFCDVGLRRWELTSVSFRMSKVCVDWSLEDLCEMDEDDMDELLKSYAGNKVPSFEQVRLGEEDGRFEFDGSFGWACVI